MKSASYELRNKSERRGAKLVPMGMSVENITKMFSILTRAFWCQFQRIFCLLFVYLCFLYWLWKWWPHDTFH